MKRLFNEVFFKMIIIINTTWIVFGYININSLEKRSQVRIKYISIKYAFIEDKLALYNKS